ncbi:unnamed protein product [Brassicogethes aeneus]|uniref:Protein phosphatase 1 regulatory subunit 35 C-terminal domain-containing protein n=1 Tax=Brassicogethes aeneus TaxID=1431903 RepID=A0A9P0BDW3_BRAAE|nr:unnamed protein product [Brassicogethes aeneus]
MNKGKAVNAKKVLIRNSKQSLPKTKQENEEKTVKIAKSTEKISKCEENDDFELPELYSALKLAKKIEEIGNYKKNKSSFNKNDNKIEKLAIDEKVTKKMNFPYDQAIYRDLIQLNSHGHQNQCLINKNKVFSNEKDLEPNLADFSDNYVVRERFYKPNVNSLNKGLTNCNNNNLKLYNILRIHE